MAVMAQNTTINFLDLDGRVNSAPLSTESEKPGTVSLELDYLEALALDPTGYCYSLTSHWHDVKDTGGLNIEALEMSLDQQRLWIGFRSPLQGRRAVIASDDGSRATGRCARFLLLDPGQLQIAP
jgi:hypothetical protein